jgi:elongation factor 1-gamma
MSLVNSDMLPAIGGVILPLIGKPLTVRRNSQDCLRAFYTDCKLMDDHLKGGQYLVGNQLTVADLFAVSELQFAVMVFHKVLRAEYPRLWEWFQQVWETPMFKDVAGELQLLNVPIPTLEHEN